MDARIDTRVIGEFGYDQAMFGMGLSFGVTSGMRFEDFSPELIGEKYRKMARAIENNCSKDGGHDKSLESIQIWLDVNAPRFWWSEADTYRLSTKQSESTMHTLIKQINVLSENMKTEWCYCDTSKLGGPCPVDEFFLFGDSPSVEKIDSFVKENFDVGQLTEEEAFYPSLRAVKLSVIMIAVGLWDKKDEIERLLFAKRLLPECYMQRRVWCMNYKTFRNIVLQRFNHRLPHWHKFIDDVFDQIQHPELIKKEMKAFGGLNLQEKD